MYHSLKEHNVFKCLRKYLYMTKNYYKFRNVIPMAHKKKGSNLQFLRVTIKKKRISNF